MNLTLACMVIRDTINDWYHWYRLAFLAAVAVFGFVGRCWRFFPQWLRGIRGRTWAEVSAVIDVVSVVAQTEPTRTGERIVGYLGTLTYFYRNPELQMGEYSRMFGKEEDAQDWTASYKGRSVMVHVDPRDSANSVLRKEEI